MYLSGHEIGITKLSPTIFRIDLTNSLMLNSVNVKNKLLKDFAQNHEFVGLGEIEVLGLNYSMF